ncbi:65-kDa microtubule-associated protein 5 [Vitis vinifera]|uniref:65-kDa microtubule-associated protein 5 n=1 Tax=Vitis vinifera TaxID=29760 RepID=A0A438IJN3_VITVI|nr:65-kDa microtubule-associated protein 5 [Vitis vinifera]
MRITCCLAIVENLTAKVKAWEMEKGMPFFYDKVPLLQTLEEYIVLRQEREEEKRRSRYRDVWTSLGFSRTFNVPPPVYPNAPVSCLVVEKPPQHWSRNGYKNNLLQSKRLYSVLSPQQKSHWAKAPMLTHWQEHQLAAVFRLLHPVMGFQRVKNGGIVAGEVPQYLQTMLLCQKDDSSQ